MKKIYFASSNLNKFTELKEQLEGVCELLMPTKQLTVDEDGQTFQENAYKKAKAYFDHFQKPVIADDSGLCVHSLPNLLGVHSARFEPELNYPQKCQALINLMQGQEDRSASFVCVLCYYASESSHFFFEGKLLGQIGQQIAGDGGFGYDPVFYPDQGDSTRSLAQQVEWKQAHSHRALATAQLRQFLTH